jgi:O-antigen/teichoic acid export membrane protein
MSASLTAAGSIAFAVSAVCLLLNHMGIYGLVVAAYVQIVVTSVGGYIVLRQIHGGLFVDPRRIPRALYSQLLKFGGWVQIGSIAMLLVDDTPAFVLGFMVGVQAVALLDVGTRLARVVRNLSYNFNSAFLPMISAVHAEDGEKRASKVVSTANRFMGIISFASTGFVISTAPLLLQVWLGRGFPHARSVVMIVAVLAFVYLIEGITGVAVTGVRGIGKPWLGSLYSGAYALSVISLSFILTPTLGLRGVAIALVCSTALASSLFFVISSTRAHVKGFGSAIGEWIVRASLATGIATITVVLINAKLDVRALNRPNAVLALAATAIVYALVLATALRAVQFFSQRDFDTVGALLPRRFATLFTANWLRGLLASR